MANVCVGEASNDSQKTITNRNRFRVEITKFKTFMKTQLREKQLIGWKRGKVSF